MANRFSDKSHRDFSIVRNILLPIAFLFAILWTLSFGLDRLDSKAQAEQLRAVEDAVVRTAVQCYALEGQYPPSVQYMIDEYGLQVDTDRYTVHYQVFAGNLMPDIAIYVKE